MKNKTWYVILSVVLTGIGSYELNDYLNKDTSHKGKILVRTNGVNEYVDIDPSKAKTVSKSQSSSTNDIPVTGSVPKVIPPRMLNAPSYDKLLMASRIINEAVNQEAAQVFIALKENLRNARMQSETARLNAEKRKYEAEFESSSARILKSKNGEILDMAPDMIQARTNSTIEQMAEGEVSINDKSIRFAQLDNLTHEMLIKVGEKWFKNVRPGQTVGGYLVGNIDYSLECVPLQKTGEDTVVICLN
ncbi:MAG: hypothetical protein V7749_00700 [Cocleimonas sp.]